MLYSLSFYAYRGGGLEKEAKPPPLVLRALALARAAREQCEGELSALESSEEGAYVSCISSWEGVCSGVHSRMHHRTYTCLVQSYSLQMRCR